MRLTELISHSHPSLPRPYGFPVKAMIVERLHEADDAGTFLSGMHSFLRSRPGKRPPDGTSISGQRSNIACVPEAVHMFLQYLRVSRR
eukprot:scaffold4372_cov397-Prasinococcus_capsulatus_cf.AAC.29